jgi:uncharacterized membrane protein
MMIVKIISKIPFAVMTGFAFLLFVTTMVYWNFKPDVNFLLTKQDVVHAPLWRTAFYIHIASGMLAIASGPFQFIIRLRERHLSFHRMLGKIYVTAILFVGAPTGLYMSFYANGGLCASVGFILMSVLWFYTTYMGIRAVMKKQITEHRKWMMRSYAVTFSAVSLRLWVPFLAIVVGMDPLQTTIVTAWISWWINLIIAEILIQFIFYQSKKQIA